MCSRRSLRYARLYLAKKKTERERFEMSERWRRRARISRRKCNLKHMRRIYASAKIIFVIYTRENVRARF